MNSREIALQFLQLPTYLKVKIAKDLDLFEEHYLLERRDSEFAMLVFRRAKDTGKIEVLAKSINKEHSTFKEGK